MRSRATPAAGAALLGLVLAVLPGCVTGGQPGPIVRTEPPPPYAEAAAAFNKTIDRVHSLIAPQTASISWVDDKGERHREDFDGVLQVIRPDRLALSITKVGQRVAWIGCDAERFWWIEFGDNPRATVGSNDRFSAAMGADVAMPVAPHDLIVLVGIVPISEDADRGATQWSADGRLLGVTTRRDDGGYERVWVDPGSYRAARRELFDADRTLIVVAEYGDYGPVVLRHDFGARPSLAQDIRIVHPSTGTRLHFDLGAMSDGPISDEAFDFDRLVARFGIDHVDDLDHAPSGVNP